MIKVGILGYGNLGRGVEAAIKKNDDMELVAVYTRRDPSTLTIKTPTAAVKSTADLDTGKEELDILVICGGSATDLPEMTPKYAAMYNVMVSSPAAGIPVCSRSTEYTPARFCPTVRRTPSGARA